MVLGCPEIGGWLRPRAFGVCVYDRRQGDHSDTVTSPASLTLLSRSAMCWPDNIARLGPYQNHPSPTSCLRVTGLRDSGRTDAYICEVSDHAISGNIVERRGLLTVLS